MPAKGPAVGYIFVIKDPRLPDGKNIVYVGNGLRPWESVIRHLKRSSNPAMAEWATGLANDFPEGFEVLGQVVAERYHGERIELPPPQPGLTRIEWDIIDVEEEDISSGSDDSRVLQIRTRKNSWIASLRAQGHPLKNESAGRPRLKPLRPAFQINRGVLEK